MEAVVDQPLSDILDFDAMLLEAAEIKNELVGVCAVPSLRRSKGKGDETLRDLIRSSDLQVGTAMRECCALTMKRRSKCFSSLEAM